MRSLTLAFNCSMGARSDVNVDWWSLNYIFILSNLQMSGMQINGDGSLGTAFVVHEICSLKVDE